MLTAHFKTMNQVTSVSGRLWARQWGLISSRGRDFSLCHHI